MCKFFHLNLGIFKIIQGHLQGLGGRFCRGLVSSLPLLVLRSVYLVAWSMYLLVLYLERTLVPVCVGNTNLIQLYVVLITLLDQPTRSIYQQQNISISSHTILCHINFPRTRAPLSLSLAFL